MVEEEAIEKDAEVDANAIEDVFEDLESTTE